LLHVASYAAALLANVTLPVDTLPRPVGFYPALSAVGIGTEPDDLALDELENGDAYHFDLDQPMHAPVMVASHAARADGDAPPPRRRDWHADQLRLMSKPGHGS
jgi:hypothetical protein